MQEWAAAGEDEQSGKPASLSSRTQAVSGEGAPATSHTA